MDGAKCPHLEAHMNAGEGIGHGRNRTLRLSVERDDFDARRLSSQHRRDPFADCFVRRTHQVGSKVAVAMRSLSLGVTKEPADHLQRHAIGRGDAGKGVPHVAQSNISQSSWQC